MTKRQLLQHLYQCEDDSVKVYVVGANGKEQPLKAVYCYANISRTKAGFRQGATKLALSPK